MVFAIHKTRCATSLTTSLSMRNRGIQRYLVHTTTYTELRVIIYYDLVGGRSPQTPQCPHWHDDGVYRFIITNWVDVVYLIIQGFKLIAIRAI